MGQEDRRRAQQGGPAEDEGERGEGRRVRARARRRGRSASCPRWRASPRSRRSRRASGATPHALEESGLPAFEARVMATLDEAERFRLKLQSPLGVARRALARARSWPSALAVLQGDLAALDAIEARVAEGSAELRPRLRLPAVGRREGAASSSSGAATPSSTSGCASAASASSSTATGSGATSRRRRWPGCRYEVERRVDGVVDFLVEAELRAVAGRDGAAGRAKGRAPGLRGRPRRRPLQLRSRAPARERPPGGARGRRALRRGERGAPAGREGARVGGAGRAAAGLGARPRHDRGRAREHHRRRRHRASSPRARSRSSACSCFPHGGRRRAGSCGPRWRPCARS